jgi:hypothetical protein
VQLLGRPAIAVDGIGGAAADHLLRHLPDKCVGNGCSAHGWRRHRPTAAIPFLHSERK